MYGDLYVCGWCVVKGQITNQFINVLIIYQKIIKKNILMELLFGFHYAPMWKDKPFLTHLQEIDFSCNEIEAISLKEPFEKKSI